MTAARNAPKEQVALLADSLVRGPVFIHRASKGASNPLYPVTSHASGNAFIRGDANYLVEFPVAAYHVMRDAKKCYNVATNVLPFVARNAHRSSTVSNVQTLRLWIRSRIPCMELAWALRISTQTQSWYSNVDTLYTCLIWIT